jgi:hypothetical protein
MSQSHDKMVRALRKTVVPRLREKGFKGSFPHFRRPGNRQIDLLSFQFDKWGGGFVIEISKCPPGGITTPWGEHIEAAKVKAGDLHPSQRHRLQPRHGSSTADWFRYDAPTARDGIFTKIAAELLPYLERAEKWWQA